MVWKGRDPEDSFVDFLKIPTAWVFLQVVPHFSITEHSYRQVFQAECSQMLLWLIYQQLTQTFGQRLEQILQGIIFSFTISLIIITLVFFYYIHDKMERERNDTGSQPR